jgi:hypothetical protein
VKLAAAVNTSKKVVEVRPSWEGGAPEIRTTRCDGTTIKVSL